SGRRFGGSGSLLVVENAATGFAAEASGLDVLFEKRTRTVFVAERAVQMLKDAEAHVEPHEIDELEWAHGMIETELERFVDVRGGSDTFLKHVKSFVANHGVDAAGDEAANNFEQFHLLYGIEEVQANAIFSAKSDGGHFGDGKRRGVAGENGAGLGEFIKDSENFELGF